MYYIAIMLAGTPYAVHDKTSKALTDAFYTSLVAFVFGMSLGRSLEQSDSSYIAATIVTGAFLIFAIFWTCRATRRVTSTKYATSLTAKKTSRQFLIYCIAFATNAGTFGITVAGAIWKSDIYYVYSAVFWAGLTCVSIFCILREAKRLTAAL